MWWNESCQGERERERKREERKGREGEKDRGKGKGRGTGDREGMCVLRVFMIFGVRVYNGRVVYFVCCVC